MPELRFDYATADWVVFAPLRKLRPHARGGGATPAVPDPASEHPCPFCPGNESLTPHVLDQELDGGRWVIRVVPNKFPALQIEEPHQRLTDGPVFQRMGGCGAHEVVIETPEHTGWLANQPVEHIRRLIGVLHRRYVDLLRDRRFQAVIVFKNHGERAGTSLRHPHWQIIATPVIPRLLQWKHLQAQEHYNRTGICLYDQILSEELRMQTRVIASNAEFVAFLPYAGHLPFECWIVPRRPQAGFGLLQPSQHLPLAELLRWVLARLHVSLDDPDFNLTIDTAARGDEDEPYFRWHIRILPRLTTTAGFELGSGMSINTVLPEEGAEFLRAGDSATH
jgi:UDPglucose--hexose-1-phosphate uridylyltransferase